MRRLILGAILLLGCGDCGASEDDGVLDAAVDGSPVDGSDTGSLDMGPPPLVLRVEPVVGVSGDLPSNVDYIDLPGGHEIVRGSAREMLVPGETRDTGSFGGFLGRRDEGGDFRWLRMEAPVIFGDHFEDSTWLYFDGPFTTAEHSVEEVAVEEPTLIRWGSDDSLRRFPIPDGVTMWVLAGAGSNLVNTERFAGLFQEWEPVGAARMVMGHAPGGTTLGGTLLEGTGDAIPFVATLSEEGLSGVRALGSGIRVGVGESTLAAATVMPGGDVVLAVTETVDGAGEVLGEPVGARQGLFRIDPVAGTVVRRWALDTTTARTFIQTEVDAPHLVVGAVLGEGDTLTLGDQTHAPNGETDLVTFRWDGAGPVPEVERRPADVALREELWVAGDHTGRDGSLLLRRYDESYTQVLAVRTTGRVLFAVPWEGRAWAAIAPMRETLDARLFGEGTATFDIPLEPVIPGNRTLWVVELAPETGEILRRRAVDLGPPPATREDEEPPILVRPVTADYFLLGRGSYLEARATLTVHSIDGGEPSELTAQVLGGALMSEETCERLYFDSISPVGTLATPLFFDPWIVELQAYCLGGDNELGFGDATFTFSNGRSEAVFRLVPE